MFARAPKSLVIALALTASLTARAQATGAPPPAGSAPPSASPAPSTTPPPKTAPNTPPGRAPQAAPTAPAEPVPATLYAKLAGLSVRELTTTEKTKLGRVGYLVDAVTAESPAAKGGVQKDDVLTSIDGASPENARALVEKLNGAEEGQLFKLSLVRAGKDVVVDVQMPGETKEEREKREEEERKKKEEEEAKEKEEEEAKAKEDAEDAAKDSGDEATDATKDGAENLEQASVDDDKFGPLGCCICSALCFPATPVFIIAMLLVDATPPARTERAPKPPQDDERVIAARY